MASKFKFGGKELSEELGINTYDFGARNYDPALGRWFNMDNHAENYMNWSPYNYAYNNPINVVDPDGQDGIFINENGEEIGNDGKDDGKVYVIKTDVSSVESGAPIDGITTVQKALTESYIKLNSGDSEAFSDIYNLAYDNSVEIEGGESTRQSMVDIVNKDDGTGGTKETNPNNLTEFGGVVKNDGSVVESTPGEVGSGGINHTGNYENAKSTFHSHPSGDFVGASGETMRSSYGPSASSAPAGDINPYRVGRTNYVFQRNNGKVYIYNGKSGVQAIIPQSNFVKLPKK